MAKKSAKSRVTGAAVIAAPAGKKIVFAEEDTIDGDLDVSQDQSLDEDDADSHEDEVERGEDGSDDQTDSDDDEAPEAVGFAVDKRKAKAEEDVEAARRKAKVERQKHLQAQREAEKKAASEKAAASLASKAAKSSKTKRVLPESDSEGGETASEGGSEVDSDDEGFHTDSGDDLDADLDEEDVEEGDEDFEGEDDEEMEHDENDPAVKRLQARMQKAMEAAERRALEEDEKPSKKKSGKAEIKEPLAAEGEEPSEYDMGPMPLPQSVLRVAAEADLLRKKAAKRKAEEAKSTTNRKRRRRLQRDEEDLTSRALNSRTSIQLLPDTFSTSSLPPVVAPRAQVTRKTNLDGFRNRAMRRSGVALGTKANSRKPASLTLAQGSKAPAPRFDR